MDILLEYPGATNPLAGFADRLQGVGVSGVDIDLDQFGWQVISPNLSLWLWFPGTVEFSP